MNKDLISIVTPVYCEGKGVPRFASRIAEVMGEAALPYEIVFVDDGSTDNTWQQVLALVDAGGPVRGIKLSRNFGKETALFAGLDIARGDVIVTIDSDLQHPPELIPEMYALWKNGEGGIIEAVKEKRQKESVIDRLSAKLFYRLFHRLTDLDLRDASDFKLYGRDVLEALGQLHEKSVFYRGMTKWIGFPHTPVYFTPAERAEGQGKWSTSKKLKLAINSFSSYTAKPLMLIWMMCVVFIIFALLVGGEALWMKLHGVSATGFTTVILLVLITGAAVLLSISLLSVYIRQIFHEIKGRPRYLVARIAEKKSDA